VTEAATQVASTSSGSKLGNKDYGLISNVTSDTVVMNADGTVSTPYGTYDSATSYNIANNHVEPDDPENMTQMGYLTGDNRMKFLVNNQNCSVVKTGYTYDWQNNQMTVQEYIKKFGITSADLAAYNITLID
jgi:hypothetical protein